MDDDRLASPENAEEPAAAALGIGETLRSARKERGVTLEEASELLRIETRFLAALEDERFDEISAPVFVKGYLKLYCELLGLDPLPLLDALSERISNREPELKGRRPVEDEEKPAALLPLVVAALVVAVGAIVWWQLDDDSLAQRIVRESTAGLGESGRVADTESATPALGNVSPQAADVSGNALPQAAAVSFQPVSGSEPIAGAANDQTSPESISAVSDDVSLSPDAAPDGGETPATAVESASAALEIELRFEQDSWAEITTASGERLLYGTITAGREERIATDGDVSVRLGNADGVSIKVNGEPFAYPPGSRRGSLAVFTLSFPED